MPTRSRYVLVFTSFTLAAMLAVSAGPSCLGNDQTATRDPGDASSDQLPTVTKNLQQDPANAPYNALIWNARNAATGRDKVDRSPWFEWWYYKIVLPESGQSFYTVYGVVNPWDEEQTQPASRAYVGFGNFSAKATLNEDFPVEDFYAAYDKTEVRIGANTLTDKEVSGELVDEEGNLHSWAFTVEFVWEFNAMGWGLYVPKATNIGWFPAQASARCSGTISSFGVTHDFQDVPCYQDRNWGNEFPTWWSWIVSNHFEGHPEILGVELLEGVCIGLLHQGVVYSFRPNHLNPVFVDMEFGRWELSAYGGGYKIELKAEAPRESFLDLVFQTPQGDIFHDLETLTGHVAVKLYRLQGVRYELVADLMSDYAGIEYGSPEVALE